MRASTLIIIPPTIAGAGFFSIDQSVEGVSWDDGPVVSSLIDPVVSGLSPLLVQLSLRVERVASSLL